MAWLAKDKDGTEVIFDEEPCRCADEWVSANEMWGNEVTLPSGSIAKLIGRELTWEDKPVEIK